MSVRGELRRTLGDTISCLEEAGAPAQALVAALARAREDAERDLAAAAREVLVAWEAAPTDALPLEAALRSRLDAASERALAIARIILGR